MKDDRKLYEEFNKVWSVKDWIAYICCIAIIFFICIFGGGCKTTSSAVGSDGYTNAYIIGQLTESVNEFDRGIEATIAKSRNITDEIDRIDNLFSEYERAAIKLRDEIDNLRKQIEDENKSHIDRISIDSSTCDSIYSYDDSNGKGN